MRGEGALPTCAPLSFPDQSYWSDPSDLSDLSQPSTLCTSFPFLYFENLYLSRFIGEDQRFIGMPYDEGIGISDFEIRASCFVLFLPPIL